MPKPEVRIFRDLEDLSRQAAARFLALASERVAEGNSFCVAISGGSTPRRLCQLLASPEFSDQISWEYIHFFQVDERSVPPDDQDSNYRLIRESLLSRAPIPDSNVHRMAAERPDLDEASREYADELAEVLPPRSNGFPRLDLVFLGMGPDGHTASLFPGSDALSEETAWVRPNYVEKFKTHRMTLTFPVLNAAAEVIFLVAGEDKAETLREVLYAGSTMFDPGSSLPARYPAQMIRPVTGQLRWYVDATAARLL